MICNAKPKPWYSRLGPLSWYRREWYRLDLMWGNRILLLVCWKPWRYFCIDIGGRVHARSRYGSPSIMEPRWSWWWMCREAWLRNEQMGEMAREAARQDAERN